MSIVLLVLIIAAIIGVILAGMGKCPLWVPVLLGLIALALVVLPGTGVSLR